MSWEETENFYDSVMAKIGYSSSQIKETQAAKASILYRTAQGQAKCHSFYRFNKILLFLILQHRH